MSLQLPLFVSFLGTRYSKSRIWAANCTFPRFADATLSTWILSLCQILLWHGKYWDTSSQCHKQMLEYHNCVETIFNQSVCIISELRFSKNYDIDLQTRSCKDNFMPWSFMPFWLLMFSCILNKRKLCITVPFIRLMTCIWICHIGSRMDGWFIYLLQIFNRKSIKKCSLPAHYINMKTLI